MSATAASSSSPSSEQQTTKLGFRQLFDEESSTYTYLVWDVETKEGVIVDPVDIQIDRDMQVVKEEGLTLLYGGKLSDRQHALKKASLYVMHRDCCFSSSRHSFFSFP
jgi:hypothetical protein